MTYKPLPDIVYLKKSKIHGTGLFVNKDLPKDYEFGITHVYDPRFENNYIRTPLGAFFNHSDDPNCEAYCDGDLIKLRSLRSLSEGEEITVKYWLYKIKTE